MHRDSPGRTRKQDDSRSVRQVVTNEVDGRVRRFTIQMPPGGTGDQPLPVVVVPAWSRGPSGSHYLAKNGWAEKADCEKFLVVAPTDPGRRS